MADIDSFFGESQHQGELRNNYHMNKTANLKCTNHVIVSCKLPHYFCIPG